MPCSRRQLLTAAMSAFPLGLHSTARAQGSYPDKPITLVDAFAAGGSSDIFARVLAERMAPLWGGSVVVENKAGAGGALGAEFVARARPDGYTLHMATVSTLVTNPAINPKLRYDPLKDFSYISNLLIVPSVLVVHPSVAARTLKALVELSIAKPQTVSFASPGVGSAGHVLLEQFMQLSGAKFLHVPYKGSSGVINDLLGGQLMVASDNLPSMLPHIQSGKLRAIAVRDNKRLTALPNVPTYTEEGYPEVSEPLWFGLVGPAGLAPDIVARLNRVVQQAVASQEFQLRLASVGATAATGTPEKFQEQVRALLERYRMVVKTANIKID
jgi:tripartite-type tricarboxylate transporter receptor subunit TctC